MLIKNNGASSKRPEIFNASALNGSVATSGMVDNPTPSRTSLPAYEGLSRAPAEDTKVITIGKGVVFSGKVIEAERKRLAAEERAKFQQAERERKAAEKAGLRAEAAQIEHQRRRLVELQEQQPELQRMQAKAADRAARSAQLGQSMNMFSRGLQMMNGTGSFAPAPLPIRNYYIGGNNFICTTTGPFTNCY